MEKHLQHNAYTMRYILSKIDHLGGKLPLALESDDIYPNPGPTTYY